MKFKPVFAAVIIIICGCNQKTTTEVATNTPVTVKYDTIKSLSEIRDSFAYFKSPSGEIYQVMVEKEPEGTAPTELKAKLAVAEKLDCITDDFHGEHRKAAKTTVAKADTVVYTTLGKFIKSLPADDVMLSQGISKKATSKRVAAENRNVSLKAVYIYAIKREPDNDYHIIIGNYPNNGVYFNVENSGLPKSTIYGYKAIKNARKQIEGYFGEYCSEKYLIFKSPIPIEITGSLFFDVDHKAGIVGPKGYRPATAWEIHPITNITFK